MEHRQFNLPVSPPAPQSQDYVPSGNVLRFDKTVNVKDKHVMGDKEWRTVLGQTFGRTAFSTLVTGSVYSVAVSDYLIGVTSLSYAPSVGLPSPKNVGPGKHYIIKDEAGGAATTTITIRSAAEETIDGAATTTITSNYGTKELYSDGANWFTK